MAINSIDDVLEYYNVNGQLIPRRIIMDSNAVSSTTTVNTDANVNSQNEHSSEHLGPTVSQNQQTDNFRGNYGFNVSFECDSQPTKSVPWTYSTLLDRLFVTQGTPFPVQFKFTISPPDGSIIRAMPVYRKPEHVTRSVRRCYTHKHEEENDPGHDPARGAPLHVLRCECSSAVYQEVEQNDETFRNVSFPYHKPTIFPVLVTKNYKFTCKTSCVGGMNRKPINVVFTLERKDGTVIGRRVLGARICACPGRDRNNYETRFTKIQEQLQEQQPQFTRDGNGQSAPATSLLRPNQAKGKRKMTATASKMEEEIKQMCHQICNPGSSGGPSSKRKQAASESLDPNIGFDGQVGDGEGPSTTREGPGGPGGSARRFTNGHGNRCVKAENNEHFEVLNIVNEALKMRDGMLSAFTQIKTFIKKESSAEED